MLPAIAPRMPELDSLGCTGWDDDREVALARRHASLQCGARPADVWNSNGDQSSGGGRRPEHEACADLESGVVAVTQDGGRVATLVEGVHHKLFDRCCLGRHGENVHGLPYPEPEGLPPHDTLRIQYLLRGRIEGEEVGRPIDLVGVGAAAAGRDVLREGDGEHVVAARQQMLAHRQLISQKLIRYVSQPCAVEAHGGAHSHAVQH